MFLLAFYHCNIFHCAFFVCCNSSAKYLYLAVISIIVYLLLIHFIIFAYLIMLIMDLDIMRCTHCGSDKYVKNGPYQGSQRFRSKTCLRYFSDKVRKFNYSDKEKFLQLYLKNTGIRNAAKIIGCSPSLLVRWVRELSGNLRAQYDKVSFSIPPDSFPDVIEMDEIYTRVKKGIVEFLYGLLVVGGSVKLLHLQ